MIGEPLILYHGTLDLSLSTHLSPQHFFHNPMSGFAPTPVDLEPSCLLCKIQCCKEAKMPYNSRPSKCCSDHWSYLLGSLGTGAGIFFHKPRNDSPCACRNIEATTCLRISCEELMGGVKAHVENTNHEQAQSSELALDMHFPGWKQAFTSPVQLCLRDKWPCCHHERASLHFIQLHPC